MNNFIRLLRPQQWLKNIFVLASLFFGGHMFSGHSAIMAFVTFVLFCLVSSAVYIFNDICDRDADKQHAKKRTRPLASGAIAMPVAIGVMAALIALAGIIFYASAAPWRLGLVLAIYIGINLIYSLGAKHVPLVELFMVASGFVLRLIAGGVAIDAPLTSWILVCTGLVSLLMVTGKRRADLLQDNDPTRSRRALLHYTVPFLDNIIVVLSSATLVTYLLFCVGYGKDRFGDYVELTAVFVALGIFRFMQIVIVEKGGDAPTALVARDRVMQFTLASWAVVFFALIYGWDL